MEAQESGMQYSKLYNAFPLVTNKVYLIKINHYN
jgi:hypothetical protein